MKVVFAIALCASVSAWAGEKQLTVEKMTCENCAQSIKKELAKIAGIQKTEVNVEKKKVSVTFDDATGFNESKVKERIEFLGYKVTEIKSI